MLYKVEAEKGTISFHQNVIGTIILKEVEQFNGKVLISNAKGKIAGKLARMSGMDDLGNLEIVEGPQGIDIRIFIVVKFGISISAVTSRLIDAVCMKIKNFTGIEPNSVSVIITGTMSKQLARRHIEVKR